MDLLVVFCSTLHCKKALSAYVDLVKEKPGTGMAIMDFSIVAGSENSEEENKKALQHICRTQQIPVYFFGQRHLNDVTQIGLLPEWLVSIMLSQHLDYGWMRNKAYLLAMATGAKALQFFDIDTVPIVDRYPNILKIHWSLLQEPKMAATSGNYLGPRAVTTSMFRNVEAQIGFLRLLKKATTFDVLDPPVIGGALAVNLDFTTIAPFPMLRETTMSDDLLITYLARLLGWETQQSGELVDHQHGGTLDPEKDRKALTFIPRYFTRMMRITALMAALGNDQMRNKLYYRMYGSKNDRALNVNSEQIIRDCEDSLEKFLDDLSELAATDDNQAHLIPIIESLKTQVACVCREITKGVENYMNFLPFWPTITENIRTRGPEWVCVR